MENRGGVHLNEGRLQAVRPALGLQRRRRRKNLLDRAGDHAARGIWPTFHGVRLARTGLVSAITSRKVEKTKAKQKNRMLTWP